MDDSKVLRREDLVAARRVYLAERGRLTRVELMIKGGINGMLPEYGNSEQGW
jgi:hypothetical protein